MESLADALSHLFVILEYNDLLSLSCTSKELSFQLTYLSKKQHLWYKRTEVLTQSALQSRPHTDWMLVYKNLAAAKNTGLLRPLLSHLDSLQVAVEWEGEQRLYEVEYSLITSAAVLEYLLSHKRYEARFNAEKDKAAIESIYSGVRSCTLEEVMRMIKVAAQNIDSSTSYRVIAVVESIRIKNTDMLVALTTGAEYLPILEHPLCLHAALDSNDRDIVTYVLLHQDPSNENPKRIMRTCIVHALDVSLSVFLERCPEQMHSLCETKDYLLYTSILTVCVRAGLVLSTEEWSQILLSAVDKGDVHRMQLALKYGSVVTTQALALALALTPQRTSTVVLRLLIQDERTNPLPNLKTLLCSAWLGMREEGLLIVLSSRKIDVDELSRDILEDIYSYFCLSEEDGMSMEEFVSPSSDSSRIARYVILKEPTRAQLEEYMDALRYTDGQGRHKFLLCCK